VSCRSKQAGYQLQSHPQRATHTKLLNFSSARIYRPSFRENKPKTGSTYSGTGLSSSVSLPARFQLLYKIEPILPPVLDPPHPFLWTFIFFSNFLVLARNEPKCSLDQCSDGSNSLMRYTKPFLIIRLYSLVAEF
jgi:hypothetical protein